MKILSHPEKLLSDHLANVAIHSKKIIESKNLKLAISTQDLSEIAYLIGLCHDFGKTTTFFQTHLTTKDTSDERLRRHSLISSIFGYHIILRFCEHMNLPEKYALLGAFAIKKHHGNLDNIANLFNIDDTDKQILNEQVDNIISTGNHKIYDQLFHKYEYYMNIEETLPKLKGPAIDSLWNKLEFQIFKTFGEDGLLEDFLLGELLYSVLIDCDKKDAADLSQSLDTSRIEINENAVDCFLKYQRKTNPGKFDPKDEREHQLVVLKNRVFNHCVNNCNLSADTKIYSITAPTGIGKTYTSLATALKLKSKIKEKTGNDYRIHYILPFTTVIDQNYDEFHKVLSFSCNDFSNRENDYIIKHHYLAADSNFYLKKMSEDNNKHYISKSYFDDLLFVRSWDAKVVISTYVQLMHTIIGGKNSFMNKFHNIVNSIIILDEVQCISLKYWELMRALTRVLAENFNVYFIFLTATQPLILKEDEVHELSDLSVFENNLMDRVQIIDQSTEEITIDDLYCRFKEFEMCKLQDRYIFILNTKRSSLQLYKHFVEDKENGQLKNHEVYYLSTNLTKNDRDNVLKIITGTNENHTSSNTPKRFILITTQLIEAGVDISSDVCYRDLAPIDSIIQSAGRVNRFGELKDKKGIIWLIKIKEIKEDGKTYFPNSIYDSNLILWTADSIEKQKPSSSKDFQRLCNYFFELGYNPTGETKRHCSDLITEIRKLNFTYILSHFNFLRTYPTYSIFILNEDSEALMEEYRKAFHTHYDKDDRFRSRWKGQLKRIRSRFNRFTIEISLKYFAKQANIINNIKELGDEFYYIDLRELDEQDRDKIYSRKIGFNMDLDEAAEFI